MIETAPPAASSPSAATSDQTYASFPLPMGCLASGGRRERRFAVMRNISLPLSAHECAASATIEAEPVTAAATDLATATSTFIRKATNTVVVVAELLVPPAPGNKSNDLRSAALTGIGVGPPCSLSMAQWNTSPPGPGRVAQARQPTLGLGPADTQSFGSCGLLRARSALRTMLRKKSYCVVTSWSANSRALSTMVLRSG